MNLRSYFVLLILFFSFNISNVSAQLEADVRNSAETRAGLSDLELFKDKFEFWNVGNLHVYSKPMDAEMEEYYFKGNYFGLSDKQFLSDDLNNYVAANFQSVFPVGKIRYYGERDADRAFYIVRKNTNKSPNEISMYELENNKLVFRKKLAYHKKAWLGWNQMNTWIMDVNGDTLLDLVQKTRKVTRSGKYKNEKTKIFLMQQDGNYKKGDLNLIDQNDFIFEDIRN